MVWSFYTDIKHLEVITPKQMEIKISSSSKKIEQGADFFLEGKVMGIKKRWNSRITLVTEKEYVDEMITGPFKRWKHTHGFREIEGGSGGGGNKTDVIDTIEIELPYGFLGRLFEGYAVRMLGKVFEHRKIATRKALEG